MLYEEMRLKKTGETVRVYDITDGVATIFDPSLYQRQNNGWAKVKASQVVPMDFPLNSKDYVSKTKKNKAKSRMQLLDATCRTTDGRLWNHSDIDAAVDHELALIEKTMAHSLEAVVNLAKSNGITVCESLPDIADFFEQP